MDSLVRRRGGIAPNIAYNLALLGGRPKVFATVGTDFEEYRQWLEAQGVDTTYARVIDGELTGSFFATTDQENAQMASFYPGAMAHAAELSLSELEQRPDLVVISPTDPLAMDKYVAECKDLGLAYLYDPSQQIVRVDGETLRNGIEQHCWLDGIAEFHLAQAGIIPQKILQVSLQRVALRGSELETGDPLRTGDIDIPLLTADEQTDEERDETEELDEHDTGKIDLHRTVPIIVCDTGRTSRARSCPVVCSRFVHRAASWRLLHRTGDRRVFQPQRPRPIHPAGQDCFRRGSWEQTDFPAPWK